MKKCLFVSLIAIVLCNTGIPTNTVQNKFATHGLIVLVESLQGGAMESELEYALSSDIDRSLFIPILTTGRMLALFIEHQKIVFKSCLKDFRFFRLPRGGLENLQFYLYYPKSLLKNNILTPLQDSFIDKEETTLEKGFIPETISAFERKSGILLEHFEEVIVTDTPMPPLSTFNVDTFKTMLETESWKNAKGIISTAKPFDDYLTVSRAAQSLRYVLERLFVPDSPKTNPECPLWAIYFSGHGEQYKQVESDQLYYSYYEGQFIDFLSKKGSISCLETGVFSQIISELSKKITLRFIDIGTCYGGGINTGDLLREVETGVIPPYKFIIGNHTVIGDATTSVLLEFKDFFKAIFEIDFIEPAIDWEKVAANTISISRAYKSINAAYQPVYDALSEAYKKFSPRILGAGDHCFITRNIPTYKPMESNYFTEVPFPWLQRIGKQEIQKSKNGIIEIPTTTRVVLLYTNTIPCPVTIKDIDHINAFLSAIPGDTFHIFEKLELEDKTKSFNAEELIKIFCKIKNLRAQKLFHLKNLERVIFLDNGTSRFDGPGGMIITLDKNDVNALLFSSVNKKYVRINAHWNDDVFSIDLIKIVPASWGKRDINKFNKNISWLRKLAAIQAPYRFLRDASIEMVPWKRPVEDTNNLLDAIRNGSLLTIQNLIAKGADVNANTFLNVPYLIVAVERGDLNIVKELIEHGANINASDSYDKTALMYATEKENLVIIRYLCEKGAEIDIAGPNNETALFYAIQKANLNITQYLIEQGADLTAPNDSNKTALDMASSNLKKQIEEITKRIGKETFENLAAALARITK
ncbi:MAG: hypothetical protein UV38_C0001G0280 [candidate division TM6 bacterium GW2011_GWE2_42_60]|nr:MAG: hypothetical protein UV38_C0001G0280 [candidate division TM6 bacterium GW2011_GWE2_42_60]HBY05527.1 hypothetical protein [Candidatus Dependentiae bacterium]